MTTIALVSVMNHYHINVLHLFWDTRYIFEKENERHIYILDIWLNHLVKTKWKFNTNDFTLDILFDYRTSTRSPSFMKHSSTLWFHTIKSCNDFTWITKHFLQVFLKMLLEYFWTRKKKLFYSILLSCVKDKLLNAEKIVGLYGQPVQSFVIK